MKRIVLLTNLILLFITYNSCNSKHASIINNINTLWYKQPAQKWTEALPLGNGRIGGMVFGGINQERIQLNEESLWAGEPTDTYPENSHEHLKQVQKLLLEGNVFEAEQLAIQKLASKPTSFRPYQPLGDLNLEFALQDSVYDYRRLLDMEDGIVRVKYRVGDVEYEREVFFRRRRLNSFF